MTTRLGILGGTFDPPHVGHLLLALDALERLALDRLILVPAARQPLKQDATMTDPAHRVAMVRLLAEADPRLEVDASEVDRGGLSYTVDTVRGLRAAHPDAHLVLLMGADTAATLPKWREPEALALLVELAVAGRGETAAPLPVGFRAQHLPLRRVDVSATEIRERARQGRTIRGFVPDGVAAYIEENRLYRTNTE